MRLPKALIVDDSQLVLRATARIVRQTGFDVVACTSALDALGLIQAGARFDIVISDMRMPEMSGNEFRSRAAMLWPEVESCFVFATGAEPAQSCHSIVFLKPLGADFVSFLRERSGGAVGMMK